MPRILSSLDLYGYSQSVAFENALASLFQQSLAVWWLLRSIIPAVKIQLSFSCLVLSCFCVLVQKLLAAACNSAAQNMAFSWLLLTLPRDYIAQNMRSMGVLSHDERHPMSMLRGAWHGNLEIPLLFPCGSCSVSALWLLVSLVSVFMSVGLLPVGLSRGCSVSVGLLPVDLSRGCSVSVGLLPVGLLVAVLCLLDCCLVAFPWLFCCLLAFPWLSVSFVVSCLCQVYCFVASLLRMADPANDHGFIYDDQGKVDNIKSPFFDFSPGVDQSVEEYVDRIVFQLAATIDEQLSSVQWLLSHDGRHPMSMLRGAWHGNLEIPLLFPCGGCSVSALWLLVSPVSVFVSVGLLPVGLSRGCSVSVGLLPVDLSRGCSVSVGLPVAVLCLLACCLVAFPWLFCCLLAFPWLVFCPGYFSKVPAKDKNTL
ncbi:hypothetical protein M5K25_016474 [Dendrobium thyrsiflorum]|uniref:Transmembrane protein n=1 Tax=Dendrobium thyrsiflorum TaxID=117978 RepID=A0ABD0UK69_DENTH